MIAMSQVQVQRLFHNANARSQMAPATNPIAADLGADAGTVVAVGGCSGVAAPAVEVDWVISELPVDVGSTITVVVTVDGPFASLRGILCCASCV